MSRCKKRFWTDEEKREICPQATSPWISVARARAALCGQRQLYFRMAEGSAFFTGRSRKKRSMAPYSYPSRLATAPCLNRSRTRRHFRLFLRLCKRVGSISSCRMVVGAFLLKAYRTDGGGQSLVQGLTVRSRCPATRASGLRFHSSTGWFTSLASSSF